MQYQAVVAGGTGLIGRHVLAALVASPQCAGVVSLQRKRIPDILPSSISNNTRLQQVVIPDAKIWSDRALLRAHLRRLGIQLMTRNNTQPLPLVSLCMLGHQYPLRTPSPGERPPSPEILRRVDVDLVREFARWSAEEGAQHFGFVSYLHAKVGHKQPLIHGKGEVEQFLRREQLFDSTSLFKPAWVERPGPPAERPASWSRMDWHSAKFVHFVQTHFRFLVPLMFVPVAFLPSRMHTLHPSTLALAMVRDAERQLSSTERAAPHPLFGSKMPRKLLYDDICALLPRE